MSYSTVEIIVNKKPTNIFVAVTNDLEGFSILATLTCPVTGNSFVTFKKIEPNDDFEEAKKVACLDSCRKLMRDKRVQTVLCYDYCLCNTGTYEEDENKPSEIVEVKDALLEEPIPQGIEEDVTRFLRAVVRQQRFEAYLKSRF